MAFKINENLIIDDQQNITVDGTVTGHSFISGDSIITIGAQKWMSKNLDTSIYRDGTPIPTGYNNTEWETLTTGAYAGGDGGTYGKLYNWFVIEEGDVRGLCPDGFHVPSDAEWLILVHYLDPEWGEYNNIAGNKLRSTGVHYWAPSNPGATNETGFTGLPAGNRQAVGVLSDMGGMAYFWTSTTCTIPSGEGALCHALHWASPDVYTTGGHKQFGFSIRCIGD